MSDSRRGTPAHLKGPALIAVSAALCALPVAESSRHLTTKETKRYGVRRIQHGGLLRENAADVARVRAGPARDRRKPGRRFTRHA
jgi:hypothetical protein